MLMCESTVKEKLTCAKQISGQSLIETIVAVSIIVIAIVAILAVGLTLLVLGGQSAERIMAVNLAREGVEIVYAVVYSNHLDPNETWPYGLTNDIYIINYDDDSLIDDSDPLTEDATPATFDGSETIANCLNCHLCKGDGDLHTHCAQQEVFRRMITITDGDDLTGNCGGDCEKKIISTVYWLERNRFHTVTLESRLTDWR